MLASSNVEQLTFRKIGVILMNGIWPMSMDIRTKETYWNWFTKSNICTNIAAQLEIYNIFDTMKMERPVCLQLLTLSWSIQKTQLPAYAHKHREGERERDCQHHGHLSPWCLRFVTAWEIFTFQLKNEIQRSRPLWVGHFIIWWMRADECMVEQINSEKNHTHTTFERKQWKSRLADNGSERISPKTHLIPNVIRTNICFIDTKWLVWYSNGFVLQWIKL